MIWRMEWFDVWRHGTPPVGYMLAAFGPYTAALSATGWFLGGLIGRRSPTRRTSRAPVDPVTPLC